MQIQEINHRHNIVELEKKGENNNILSINKQISRRLK